MLRDPVGRAYSQYQHELARGFETLGFEEALEKEDERLAGEEERMLADPTYRSFSHQHHSYLARGRYVDQLRRWHACVGPERLLVIDSSAFFKDPDAGYREVLSFLGLAELSLPTYSQLNAHSYGPMPDRRPRPSCVSGSRTEPGTHALPGVGRSRGRRERRGDLGADHRRVPGGTRQGCRQGGPRHGRAGRRPQPGGGRHQQRLQLPARADRDERTGGDTDRGSSSCRWRCSASWDVRPMGVGGRVRRTIPRFRVLGRTADIRHSIRAGIGPVLVIGSILAVIMAIFAEPLGRLLTNGRHGADMAPVVRALAPFVPLGAAFTVALAATRGFGTMVPSVVIDKIGRAAAQPMLALGVVALGILPRRDGCPARIRGGPRRCPCRATSATTHGIATWQALADDQRVAISGEMDRLPPTCNFEASRLQKATCEFLGWRSLTGPCRWVGT